MRFQDLKFDKDKRYALGKDVQDHCYYLSIPVRNSRIEYEEYYQLTDKLYSDFMNNPSEADRFAKECRQRLHDDLLILSPGIERGEPA
ncbi:MAG: hypothetical protein DI551_03560 [Micavibrio aeruginosavorus]|uniref:Uncharacterized protein n=1 Tax=Micavibrio aeruginosavorus TaxID=349221 RepID=A0A2W5PY28_9BACT|nr:MAG: hypothetical protein DI551_03560 [Micavibrio aeruginosavorus]